MRSEILEIIKKWETLIDGLTVTGVCLGVSKTFEWFDGMVSDKARQDLSNWLLSSPKYTSTESWSAIFPALLDRIFGRKPFSLRFLFTSCLASFVAVGACTFGYIRIHHRDWEGLEFGPTLLVFIAISLILNCIPDYLSLLISRAIVRRMRKAQTSLKIFLLFLLDLGLTAFLSFCVVSYPLRHADLVDMGVRVLIDAGLDPEGKFANRSLDVIAHNFAATGVISGRSARSVFFYSAFFTSIWVWLYLSSAMSIRLIQKVRFLWMKIVPFLDVEKKPLIAIGRVAGLVAGAGYVILLGTFWVVRHWFLQ
ncbi:MAG: hypothetical protein JO300_03835 [Silvibacterium sp.]|nr:hypothetical protein [Silvibacterium sp.]